MKKILLVLLVLVMVVSSFVGCSKSELIGKWLDEESGQSLTFNSDGTCDFGNMKVEYEVKESTLSLIIEGEVQSMQYTIEGNNLTLSFPDLDDFELIYVRVSN